MTKLDLSAIRERLAGARGPEYWRSLEELAGTEEFQDYLENEFPQHGSDWRSPLSRRHLLKMMGASLALAGVSACTRQPVEKIVPYVRPPEEVAPGKPLYYATAMPWPGGAVGLLVTSHMGRPTKVEGNPQHPASLGSADRFAQASILTLYDPDRSQVVLREGRISTWLSFISVLSGEMEREKLRKGAGIRLLTETVNSPSLSRQIRNFLAKYPEAKWCRFEPAGASGAQQAAQSLFGEPVNTICRFDQADVILSLDSDFLAYGPAALKYSRDFAARRNPQSGRGMNRLYVAESMPSITGGMADHRFPMRSADVGSFARAVAEALQSVGSGAAGAIAKDLAAHKGSSIVTAGEYQPAVVHMLAEQMNQALGNTGKTVYHTAPVEAQPGVRVQTLTELIGEMWANKVEHLFILGGNPVYGAPPDLGLAGALSNVRFRAHLGLYQDETSALCHWHIPEAHFLETWGDTRAFDGTATIMQPLIAPLYGGKAAAEVLAALAGNPDLSAHDVVKGFWQGQVPADSFDEFWARSLHDGVVARTALPELPAAAKPAAIPAPKNSPAQNMEIVFRPDPTIWDGRFSNNGWLQELPKPVTKLVWDSVVHLSPRTAERLQVTNEDLVEMEYRGRKLRAPVWIVPGHADESATVHLGYGRQRGGRLAQGTGVDFNSIRTADAPWQSDGLTLRKAGGQYPLSVTQHHHSMEGRELLRTATLGEYQQHPDFVQLSEPAPPKELFMYREYEYTGYAWGMAIDLNACTGCSACVVACQAENNIPVVGKREVGRGHEMHWIRIDRYNKGSLDAPEMYYQPVLCMHCETAPCELVCPVNATVHSSEGLNQMVYNRCVGTRYCSNNCPYKVRRFNFFLYQDWNTPSYAAMRNPEVTVRSRGVMEKCTYCVQRISAAKIESEKEGRAVKDGEIVTACQASCPTQAIVFGDINDRKSRVAKLKADPRNYGMLAELNTRPRTTYLGRLRNPNPGIEKT